MFENLNEIIDINLNLVLKDPKRQIFINHFQDLNNKPLNRSERQVIADIMCEKGLIEVSAKGNYYNITEEGFNIASNGGWLNYNKLLQDKENLTSQIEVQKKKITQAKEKVELQKLIDDAKVSRLNAKYRYVPYIVSIISIIVACLAYFKPIDKPDNKQLSKDEIIHIIDSISSSNQTKKVDSLHSSKTDEAP